MKDSKDTQDNLSGGSLANAEANTSIDNVMDADAETVIKDELKEGVTPIHRQNIDESRIDEVLVEDALEDKNYPNIKDIADDNAVAHSHEDK